MSQNTLFTLEMAIRAVVAQRSATTRLSKQTDSVTDLFLCVVDHYEPQVGRPPRTLSRDRVEDWIRRYPRIASAHRDADGHPPTHSFFYPWDEYDAWELDRIAALCTAGFGEVELHLHHRDDTEETLRHKLQDAIQCYWEHGALTKWPDGRVAWGFIHGNWALDNSRVEEGHNFCGVNNEITVLQTEGCYADFTFPSWHIMAQPRQLNSIYYAIDDPNRPKSYDTGTPACAGVTDAQGFLLIAGALVPFIDRSGKIPRFAMDDSDLASYRRYKPERLDRWVQAGIHVAGRPDRIFVKLHCHGAQDLNRAALLGEDLEALFLDAEARYNDGKRFRLHYVTAREMFNIVKATEAGIEDIAVARDWLLKSPVQARTPSECVKPGPPRLVTPV